MFAFSPLCPSLLPSTHHAVVGTGVRKTGGTNVADRRDQTILGCSMRRGEEPEHQSGCVPWLDTFWVPFCVSPSLYCGVHLCHRGNGVIRDSSGCHAPLPAPRAEDWLVVGNKPHRSGQAPPHLSPSPAPTLSVYPHGHILQQRGPLADKRLGGIPWQFLKGALTVLLGAVLLLAPPPPPPAHGAPRVPSSYSHGSAAKL